MRYYVGTSGWYYDHWREIFYPQDMAKSKWLDYYSRSFSTVELNNSFYHLPSEKAYINWKNSSPPGFVFSVKVSRFITHVKRLRDAAEPVTKFISRACLLEKKLGPLLYQLPRNIKPDYQKFEEFLQILPKDISHVFEFRHESWFDDEIFSLLRRYGVGFCIYDMPDLCSPVITTSDFAYIRFHGSQRLYGGCYSDREMEDWAREIVNLGVEVVYIYFNNDMEGYAIKNALTFKHLLEVTLSGD